MSAVTGAAGAPVSTQRPLWRRLLGFNLLTRRRARRRRLLPRVVHRPSHRRPQLRLREATDENDVALLLAYFFGVAGFLIGMGFANYPVSRLLGRPPSLREKEEEGIGRYFGLCTDHKVVGMQYLVGDRRVLLRRRG